MRGEVSYWAIVEHLNYDTSPSFQMVPLGLREIRELIAEAENHTKSEAYAIMEHIQKKVNAISLHYLPVICGLISKSNEITQQNFSRLLWNKVIEVFITAISLNNH